MSAPLRIRQVQIYSLSIPMRLRFEHAAAARSTADPVIVRLTAGSPYAHHAGFGETLARDYVTGETAETVVEDIKTVFVERLRMLEAHTFPDALEMIESLPFDDGGRVITAARAAVELALIDLACKVFRRRAADIARWMELIGFGPPGCLAEARYSGIVVGRSPGKLGWALRAQRCYGLRDFKIKVAVEGWEQKLAAAHRLLGGALSRGAATLRADANGGWTFDQALQAAEVLEQFGVTALEQPMPEQDDARLPELAQHTSCDLIADESLLTRGDARRLIASCAVRVLNIRIAKNGGLMPALRIARTALAAGVDVQLGCLVGETSILSAAGVVFLQACPSARFVEGAFGGFLLRDDITRQRVRFGRGGRIRATDGPGLGVQVDEAALKRLTAAAPVIFNL